MARVSKSDQAKAVERLSEWLEPGDTVYTILRHVSSSGMLRVISFVKIGDESDPERVYSLDWNVAAACGYSLDRNREGLRVSGAGMDMGFDVVYGLSRTLFRDSFDCIGEGCPSNDHSNGDRDYSPHRHSDGGYALRQRWL